MTSDNEPAGALGEPPNPQESQEVPPESPGVPQESLAGPPPGTPNVAGPGGSGGRRGLIAGVIAIVLAVILGGVAYAAYTELSGGGPQPAAALPGNAIAYVRIDMDPSASQKIHALALLRKFPAFAEETGITDDAQDLRRKFFEYIQDHGGECPGVDYDSDVAPWIGDRLGIAVLPPVAGSTEPSFAVALQVSDQDEGIQGFAALDSQCGGSSSDYGVARGPDGYLVFAETQQLASRYAVDAADSPLADNDQFNADMDALGDPGVVSFWVDYQSLLNVLPAGSLPPGTGATAFAKNADSMAAALRFNESYLEFAAVATGVDMAHPSIHNPIVDLPETTFAALSLSTGGTNIDELWSALGDAMGSEGRSLDSLSSQIQRDTGLVLPADLKTIVGDNVTIAMDSKDLDFSELQNSGDTSTLPLGARFQTDPAKFAEVYQKLVDYVQEQGGVLPLTKIEGDGFVAVSTDPDYASELTKDGGLGDTDKFQTAVPDAETAAAVLYLDFDSMEGQILDAVREAGGSQRVIDNLEPLSSIGVSSHVRGDGVVDAVLRITVN